VQIVIVAAARQATVSADSSAGDSCRSRTGFTPVSWRIVRADVSSGAATSQADKAHRFPLERRKKCNSVASPRGRRSHIVREQTEGRMRSKRTDRAEIAAVQGEH
jgi:hypothetical protein